MRQLTAIIFFLFAQNYFCQDTIRFKNGDIKAVKVNEIGLREISYNRLDNPDGPLYSVNKSEIVSIKYVNGQVDTFTDIKSDTQPILTPEQSINFKPKEPIVLFGNRLFYLDKKLKDKALLKLVKEYPEGSKKIKLQELYDQMDAYKAKQYLIGFLGAGVALNMAITGIIVGGNMGSNVGLLLGMGTYFTTSTISKSFKRKRAIKRMETAHMYNGD